MRSGFATFAALSAAALLATPSALGDTNVISGIFSTNATWSGTNLVIGTVVITNGAVVTIAPGTRMLMNTGATVRVHSQLIADGESNAPITFTRATTAARWGRIILDRAQPSRFRHCLFEYSNSTGDHKDYYPTNCSPPIFRPRNNYHEMIVALGSHIDVNWCVFQNLPAPAGEGDAIAIISDHPDPTDTNLWNSASGTVRNSRFIDIGQGIHTRYAHVTVEHCYFSSHNGDNDDVDMYGESAPPPMVRSNIFLHAYDDFINPTRSSAIIMDNIFVGSSETDHGIVLRDQCRPIVMNNILYRCGAGGIAIQNGCEALIVNNTIVNCNSAIKLFDHLGRLGPVYCLAAASGRATLVNNIIWNSTPAFNLSGDAIGTLAVSVSYSDIQGGIANAQKRADAVLTGGPGNIDVDPLFASTASTNFNLLPGSPAIDAGTNAALFLTNVSLALNHDYESRARPLDGNGDGSSRYDMGAFEYLLSSADSNGDGIPDGWMTQFGLSPIDDEAAAGNPDGDAHTTAEEWVADTDPTDAMSFFEITSFSLESTYEVTFPTSTNRQYTLLYSTALGGEDTTWTVVPGQTNVTATGASMTLADTNAAPLRFYKIEVSVP